MTPELTPQSVPESIQPLATGTEITGIPAFGTEIMVLSEAGPPEVFTVIQGVGDISGPNTSVAEVETTSHSTGLPHRTFIPTLIDDGELSFPCFFNPSDPTQSLLSPYGLENLFQNRTITKFRLRNTDASQRTREFLGFVKTLGETYPVQGVCTRNTAIRITSVPTDLAPPFTLTPTTKAAVVGGESGTFAVDTDPTVTWQVPTSDAAWLTVTAPTGPTTGDGDVSYTVAANVSPNPARTGHITVTPGVVFTVTQPIGV